MSKSILARMVAAIKRQKNRVTSFLLKVTSKKHRCFAFMTSSSSGRLFQYAISEIKEENRRENARYTMHNSIILCL